MKNLLFYFIVEVQILLFIGKSIFKFSFIFATREFRNHQSISTFWMSSPQRWDKRRIKYSVFPWLNFQCSLGTCPHWWKISVQGTCTIYFFCRFFLMWTILKPLLNLLQYCFYFMFWFIGQKASGILAFWPGIEPTPHALEAEVLSTRLPGKSLYIFIEKIHQNK